eukprot:9043929-Pyramimonas_sp.AAC.1
MMHCCETGQSEPRSMQFRMLARPARPTAGPWAHSPGWMLDSPGPSWGRRPCRSAARDGRGLAAAWA